MTPPNCELGCRFYSSSLTSFKGCVLKCSDWEVKALCDNLDVPEVDATKLFGIPADLEEPSIPEEVDADAEFLFWERRYCAALQATK